MLVRWVANALIGLGVLLLVYAGLWQLGLAPGSRVSLPEPVALAAPPLLVVVPSDERATGASVLGASRGALRPLDPPLGCL